MLLMLQSPNQTKSRNGHQLQFERTGTRQAAHRIAEAASRPARQSRRLYMKLRQHPSSRNSSRNSSRSKTRRNSRCCSHPTARTKPKAGTGTNCNLNAQEQDKQHIELQKQHPQMAEQAPPHEIASAALNRKNSRKNSRSNSKCCSYPRARTEPKAEPAPTAI